jgi:hypothetical protein
MDYSAVPNEVLKLWWVVPILLLIALFKTPWFRGLRGEAFMKVAARLMLPAESYHALHNVTLPTPDGTTQIDHIVVSRFGIFVVETKNMNGWTFGGDSQAQRLSLSIYAHASRSMMRRRKAFLTAIRRPSFV